MKWRTISRTKILASFVLSCCFFNSCNVAYLPSQQNVPLFSERGEGSVSISGSNIQVAGALNDAVALMGNFQYSALLIAGAIDNYEGIFNRPPYQWNLEFAPGLYKELRPKMIFEFYGGAGIGGSNVFGDDEGQRIHFNTYRLFMQPNFGYKGDKIEVALSARIIRLQYFNEVIHNLDDDWLKDNDVYNLESKSYLFAEPAFTMRYRFKDDFAGYMQVIYSNQLTSDPLKRMEGAVIFGISGRF